MQVCVSRKIAEAQFLSGVKRQIVYKDPKIAELVNVVPIYMSRGNPKSLDLVRFSNNALASTTNGVAVLVHHATALQYATDCASMTC